MEIGQPRRRAHFGGSCGQGATSWRRSTLFRPRVGLLSLIPIFGAEGIGNLAERRPLAGFPRIGNLGDGALVGVGQDSGNGPGMAPAAGATARKESTMDTRTTGRAATGTAARAARLLGRVAAVGVLALLLVGLATAPAGAQTRQQAVDQANEMISECMQVDGEPSPTVFDDGSVFVSCKIGDGYANCYWDADKGFEEHCWGQATPETSDPRFGGVVGGGTALDGSHATTGGATLTAGTAGPKSATTLAADDGDKQR
jgi:hypothetical protein